MTVTCAADRVLITAHVASGAALGRLVRRPLPALLLGLASHYLLDVLPHWGRAGADTPTGMDDAALRVAVGDGLVGLTALAAVAAAAPAAVRLPVLAGVAGACLPDLDKPGRLFFGRSPWPERHDVWHARIQTREAPGLLRRDALTAVLLAAAVVIGLRQERSGLSEAPAVVRERGG